MSSARPCSKSFRNVCVKNIDCRLRRPQASNDARSFRGHKYRGSLEVNGTRLRLVSRIEDRQRLELPLDNVRGLGLERLHLRRHNRPSKDGRPRSSAPIAANGTNVKPRRGWNHPLSGPNPNRKFLASFGRSR
jgi:hypothetical protein